MTIQRQVRKEAAPDGNPHPHQFDREFPVPQTTVALGLIPAAVFILALWRVNSV